MARKSSNKRKSVNGPESGGKSPTAAKKRLCRSSSNRVFLGVLGGLAEYFNADPAHVRILWIAFIVAVGLFVGAVAYALVPTVLTLLAVAYVIAYLLMNETPAK